MVFFAQLGDDYRQGTRALLSSVAGLANEDVPPTRVQRWRLPELCDFLNMLQDGEVGVGDFTQAVEADSPETRGSWLRYMALAADLDLRLLRLGRAALEDDDGKGLPAPIELTSAWPSMNTLKLQLDRIPSDDRSRVVGLLTARSNWIADSADRLLLGSGELGLDDRVAALFSAVGPRRRFFLALLCAVLSEQPALRLESLLESGDSSLRRAAAWLLQHRATGPATTSPRERALHDEDATVRLAAGATSLAEPGIAPPADWSFTWCLHHNGLKQADYAGCERGSRPRADEDQTA